MATSFRFDRSCIPALARQGVMQRAMVDRAERVRSVAAGVSAQARLDVAPVVTRLGGTDRAGQRVTDTGRKAIEREFGTPRSPGSRVLGRLSTRGGRT